VQYEGEELEKNVFYTGAAPNQQAIPAVEYLMSKDGGGARSFVLLGTDYVYPRTTNKILRAFMKSKGVKDTDIQEVYTPFGHADYQTIVANIPALLQPLAGDDPDARIQAVGRIAALADDDAREVLQALQDDALYATPAGGILVVDGEQAWDPATGRTLPLPEGTYAIVVNNRLRAAVEGIQNRIYGSNVRLRRNTMGIPPVCFLTIHCASAESR
jgi:hypothetical protein